MSRPEQDLQLAFRLTLCRHEASVSPAVSTWTQPQEAFSLLSRDSAVGTALATGWAAEGSEFESW
jgi:hypothetical protein